MNTDPRDDEELNRIIAEWMGWRPGHAVHWTDGCTKFYDWGWTPPDHLRNTEVRYTPGKTSCEPPPYCTDLNAMHEAEGNALNTYGDLLDIEIQRSIKPGQYRWHISARQRAEALVLVIEKGNTKEVMNQWSEP